MAEYKIELKKSFQLVGYGTTVEIPYESIPKQKGAFWDEIMMDGRWDKLKNVAKNDLEFAVNEAVNHEMWYYAAVETDEKVADATRIIEFPDAEYLIVEGSASHPGILFAQLEGKAFGQVLGSLNDYAYVGGPNVAVQTKEEGGVFYGEFWVPLVRK